MLPWAERTSSRWRLTTPGSSPWSPQIPFNGFPRRVEGRSTGAALHLFAAIVWDSLKGRLHLKPFYIPMVGKPGELAVTATHEADRHIQTLTGGNVTTLWKNQVAPRGLLQMLRYRPTLDAARLQAPLLVCAAEQDQETPVDSARALVQAAPRGTLRVYPGTHFDFYTDPAIRDRALADQLDFLYEHRSVPALRRAIPTTSSPGVVQVGHRLHRSRRGGPIESGTRCSGR